MGQVSSSTISPNSPPPRRISDPMPTGYQTTVPTHKSPFQKLNYDAILAILHTVDERDILSLRLTSKWISHCTRDRSVWAAAFDSVLEKFQIPIGSVPTAHLSSLQLEQFALKPARFEKYILNSHAATPPISLIRTLPLPHVEISFDRTYHLLPGGRWLVTGDNNGVLQVIDLDSSIDPRSSTVRCAAELPLGAEINGIQVQARHAREGAVLLVTTVFDRSQIGNGRRDVWRMVILEFVDGVPVLQEYGKPLEMDRIVAGNLCGDFVTIPNLLGTAVLWNWVSDEWVAILDAEQHAERSRSNHDIRVLIDGSYATAWDVLEGSCRAYPIPFEKLAPMVPGIDPPVIAISPVRTHQPIDETSHIMFSHILRPTSFTRPCKSSLHQNAQPIILASSRRLLFSSDSQKSAQSTTNDDPSSQLPAYKPTCSVTLKRGGLVNRATANTTINGHQVIMIYKPGQQKPLELHVTVPAPRHDSAVDLSPLSPHNDLSDGPSGDPPPSWAVRTSHLPLPWAIGETDGFRSLFCPMSARLVMISPDRVVWVFDMASTN